MKIDTFKMTPHQLARYNDIMSRQFKSYAHGTDLSFLNAELPVIDISWFMKFMNNRSKFTEKAIKLTSIQQKQLFLQYNYFRNEINRIKICLNDNNVMTMLDFHAKAMKVRQLLINGNLAALVKYASAVHSHISFDDLISDSQPVLIAAVDSFDVNTKYKFSTYLITAIKNSFGRSVKTGAIYHKRNEEMPQNFDESSSRSCRVVKKGNQDISEDKEFIKHAIATLTKDELFVIQKRYLSDEKMTTAALGLSLKCSRQNISQIEQRALKKMNEYALAKGIDC